MTIPEVWGGRLHLGRGGGGMILFNESGLEMLRPPEDCVGVARLCVQGPETLAD